MRLTFRHRLFLGLVALGTVPLAAALVALALYVRSAGSPAGPRAALDEITTSGRRMIAALDTTRLDDSARAAIRRHAETIGRRATLARRAETLSHAEAAVLGGAVLLAALGLVGVSFWLVRRWSAIVSAPVEELVDWTHRIEQGRALPATSDLSGTPELASLRAALQAMAAALERAERLRAFRETARRVAHEMRGPLNAAQLALRRLSPPANPNSDQALTVLMEETERLKCMADEFAEFGRLPQGPESQIDMTELLDNVLAATVPGGCPIERSLEPGLVIRGHYEALRRALQNVVRNAVEATDGRGIGVRASRQDSAITCVIRDHGPGVPPDLRPRIFEPYLTTKQQGTGLGLAIAHHAVTADGGTLTLEDGPAGGASFVFKFPAT